MTDQNAQPVAPVPGSPEYDAAMAAKFRDSNSKLGGDLATQFAQTGTQSEVTVPALNQRPDNIPEKFWDAEKGVVKTDDLLKSYTELEKRGVAPKADGEQAPADDEAAAQEAVKVAGLDWDDLGSQIATNGTISDEAFAALEKAGIPKALAEEVIELRKAAQDHATNDAMSYIGGSQDAAANQKATEELLSWAGQNLSDEEKAGYNEMLAGPNWKVAVDTLKTLRGQKSPGGNEPQLLSPKTVTGGSVVGYKTQDEMRVDMRNPVYNQNTPEGAAFRAAVQEKVRLAAWRNSH